MRCSAFRIRLKLTRRFVLDNFRNNTAAIYNLANAYYVLGN